LTSAPKTYRETLSEFLSHLPPRRRRQLGLLLVLMLVGSLAEIATIGAAVPFITFMAQPEQVANFPWLQQMFSVLGWQQPESLVLPMSLVFVAIVILATGLRLLLIYASNRLVFAIGRDIGTRMYEVILNQPYAYHISQNSSEIIGNINKIEIKLNAFLRPVMQGIIAAVLTVSILLALMLVNATTALVAGLVFAVSYLLVMRLFRARLRANSRVIADAQGRRVRCVQEGLGGIRDVILDGNQSHYVGEFATVDGRFRLAQSRNAFLGQAPRCVIEAVGVALIVALAYTLSLRPDGLIGALPVLGALALGAQRLLPLVQQIYQAWASFTGNYQVLEDVLETLSLPMASIPDKTRGRLPFEESINLDNVHFAYGPGQPEVLLDINLRIPKGTRVGLVGATGSGKSTLMDIVMGLLQPSQGAVRVDGMTVDLENLQQWRRRIAHVPQHIYLSDASINENIALGMPRGAIDEENVRRAAHQAQIADFIESNRQGYDTRVGERGVQLSGGQRQRIGIARALYKSAEVLVFDEASSALDTDTETAVMEAVENLDSNLTLFIIAHRVQTLRKCDLIVRLENGRLVAVGSYEKVIGNEAAGTAADMELKNRGISNA